eukprot:COSAG01_NODE_6702_length_3546_cov_3.445899_5_plen_119_part_00
MIHDQFSTTIQEKEQAALMATPVRPLYATRRTVEHAIERTKAHIVAVASGRRSYGRNAKKASVEIVLINSLRASNGAEATKKNGNATRDLYLDAERANLAKLENVLARIKGYWSYTNG